MLLRNCIWHPYSWSPRNRNYIRLISTRLRQKVPHRYCSLQNSPILNELYYLIFSIPHLLQLNNIMCSFFSSLDHHSYDNDNFNLSICIWVSELQNQTLKMYIAMLMFLMSVKQPVLILVYLQWIFHSIVYWYVFVFFFKGHSMLWYSYGVLYGDDM